MWWFLYQEVNSLRAGPKPHAALSCVLCSCSVMSNLCDTLDCSPPGSSVHGIFQARILEWVAISSSTGSFMTQWLNPCLWSLLHCNHWAIVEALCIFFFFFFCLHHAACGIRPGIKPIPSAVEVLSHIHWTAREVPYSVSLMPSSSLGLNMYRLNK